MRQPTPVPPEAGPAWQWSDEQGRQLLPVPGNSRSTSAILDTDGMVLAADAGYCAVVGADRSPVGRYWPQTLGPDSMAAAERLLRDCTRDEPAGFGGDRIVPSVQQRPHWFRIRARRAVWARPDGDEQPVLVCEIEDLTEADGASLAAELIRDQVTGLYNRRAFLDLTELSAGATQRYRRVVLVEIRGFRRINELWGQQVADLCLAEVANWLRSAAAPDDLVMRLSGSRFVLLETADSPMLELLQHAGNRAVRVGRRQILLSLQAGWAERAPDTSLLRAAEDADTALAVAKRDAWRTVVGWTPQIAEEAATAAAEEEAVQQAVATHQEAVYFQPIVDLVGRRVSGIEALVRMGGAAAALPIDRVLAVSHQLGLTPELAERVYDLAFSQGLRLQAVFPDCLIGVNISREFLSTGLAIDTVLRAADRAGVPRDQVVVELTEDVAAGLSTELLTSELQRGADLGMHMVIDDFGRGESSLSLLRRLPLSGIKLDRSLLPDNDDDRAWDFVEATVSLLGQLTDRIIAEGIETELQSRRLRGIGIHLQQGYYFGQPQPCEHWLLTGLTID
ncbi:MAG TPA: phosphodiesterase [Jatrophihabitans sp.]|nr:phosphodiesterase [Jatrophihabitans sp.]